MSTGEQVNRLESSLRMLNAKLLERLRAAEAATAAQTLARQQAESAASDAIKAATAAEKRALIAEQALTDLSDTNPVSPIAPHSYSSVETGDTQHSVARDNEHKSPVSEASTSIRLDVGDVDMGETSKTQENRITNTSSWKVIWDKLIICVVGLWDCLCNFVKGIVTGGRGRDNPERTPLIG